jgi:thioredoxin reductase
MGADLPVVVIGAGPIGLAAAAHLVERGLDAIVFERGDRVGTSLHDWAHVRVFSPWSLNVDAAAARLLAAEGWRMPDPDALPTGRELVRDYLAPLAAVPPIARGLRLGTTVTAISRSGLDKMTDAGRADTPFDIRWTTAGGAHGRTLARAVIDASGTWATPNPLGADGLPVPGEAENSERVTYGIPDVLGSRRSDYAGMRVLVAGSGHSAINVVLDLLQLRHEVGGGEVTWAIRRTGIDRLIGGGLNDQLPDRGALGIAAKAAIADGRIAMLAPFAAERVDRLGDGLRVAGRQGGAERLVDVDRIVVATGLRPDLSFLREVRISLDPAVEAPPALAPLIDPNLHSCGTVPPHGFEALAHPEPDFYIVGSKSYGRAPTFLMATGYEQARSVVAIIAGDESAARAVHLVLPETGVCAATSLVGPDEGCCGGPAPSGADACCAADAVAKAAGEEGCGCGPAPAREPAVVSASGCCGVSRTAARA